MISTFAKLRAPIAGLGRATIHFTSSFNKLHPERRMIILQQAMRQFREAHDKAERENRNLLKAEDARNAEGIRVNA